MNSRLEHNGFVIISNGEGFIAINESNLEGRAFKGTFVCIKPIENMMNEPIDPGYPVFIVCSYYGGCIAKTYVDGRMKDI